MIKKRSTSSSYDGNLKNLITLCHIYFNGFPTRHSRTENNAYGCADGAVGFCGRAVSERQMYLDQHICDLASLSGLVVLSRSPGNGAKTRLGSTYIGCKLASTRNTVPLRDRMGLIYTRYNGVLISRNHSM